MEQNSLTVPKTHSFHRLFKPEIHADRISHWHCFSPAISFL